jgi:hypothetical protein
VITEVTLFGHLVYRVKKPHSVRAGHNAIAATDAPLPVHQDDPCRSLVGGTHWAYLDTGGFGTLVAKLGHEKSLIDFLWQNLLVFSLSKIHPAGNEAVPAFLRGICEYFSILGNDVPFHPGPGDIGSEGDFIFELTGLYTEAATDAFVGIHEKYPADRLGGSPPLLGPENFVKPTGQGDSGKAFQR